MYACTYGHLRTAQWLHAHDPVTNEVAHLAAHACLAHVDSLHTVQWLLSVGSPIPIDHLFAFACSRGRMHTTKWLLRRGADLHFCSDRGFKRACECGYQHLARWLIAREPSWAWPGSHLDMLQTWTLARDAWIKAVVRASMFR